MAANDPNERWLKGGCHCAAVRFEVRVEVWSGLRCNCSICQMTGFWHLIVDGDAFRLVAGAEVLTSYRFNSGVADHTFCAVCGVKPFYHPRSHPNGISVNIRCLDDAEARGRFVLRPFDGHNWEANIDEIR